MFSRDASAAVTSTSGARSNEVRTYAFVTGMNNNSWSDKALASSEGLIITGAGGSIGGTTIGNAALIIGSTTNGIGVDANELVDLNTMMFVAIHELGHLMSKSIGHTTEFWDNMRFLLKKGIKLKVYKHIDYSKFPEDYCGIKITDTPLT